MSGILNIALGHWENLVNVACMGIPKHGTHFFDASIDDLPGIPQVIQGSNEGEKRHVRPSRRDMNELRGWWLSLNNLKYTPFSTYRTRCQYGSIPFDFALYNNPKWASKKRSLLLRGEVDGWRWQVEAHQIVFWGQTSRLLGDLSVVCYVGREGKLTNIAHLFPDLYIDKASPMFWLDNCSEFIKRPGWQNGGNVPTFNTSGNSDCLDTQTTEGDPGFESRTGGWGYSKG